MKVKMLHRRRIPEKVLGSVVLEWSANETYIDGRACTGNHMGQPWVWIFSVREPDNILFDGPQSSFDTMKERGYILEDYFS